ncbi:MAG: TolC family protein [Sphingomonadales bacterium]
MTQNKWLASCGIALACACAQAWPLAAIAEPLTLQRTLALVDEESPTLAAGRAQIDAADDEASAARQLPDPTLSFGVENLPFTGDDRFSFNSDDMTMKTIGLSQEWVGRSKRQARADQARQKGIAEMAQAGADQLKVRRQAAESWIALMLAQREAQLLDRQHEMLVALVAGTDGDVAASRLPASDAIAARQDLAARENEQVELHARIQTLKAELTQLTMVADPDAAEEAPDFAAPPIDPVQLESLVASHAAVRAADAELRSAQADRAVARAERHPGWSTELMFGQRDGDRSQMVSLMFSIPLPINRAARQDKVVAATHARELAAAAMLEKARRSALAEIRGMYVAWQSASERLGRFDTSLVPLAKRQAELAEARYGAGTGTLKEVLAAARDRIQVERERLAILNDLGRAWIGLVLLAPHGSYAPVDTAEARK